MAPPHRLGVLVAALLLAGCVTSESVEHAVTRAVGAVEGGPPAPAPSSLRFLAFGDHGFADGRQWAAARGMERVCAAEGCDLAVVLGDHWYPDGLRSRDDEAFATLRLPYENLSLPLYAVLGNHDVRQKDAANGTDSGDHLVRVEGDWRMPGRTYSFRDGDVFFVALDMTPFYRARAATNESRALAAWLDAEARSDAYRSATWRIAFSHFPYASSGGHGSAGVYDGEEGAGSATRALVEEAICGRFDLYLAGHDHDLEWLAPRAPCAGTELVVSGAGGEARAFDRNESALFQHDAGPGFFWFEARGSTLTGRAYDANATLLFERAVVR